MATNPKKFYAKHILHTYSQFSYIGGCASCTYICNEVAIHALQGALSYYSRDEIQDLINKCLKVGVYSDKGIGYRSTDEVQATVARFKDNLVNVSLSCGKLKDPESFIKLMDCMMKKALIKREQEENAITVVVFTKTPETILICVDASHKAKYPVIIFDSHPRSFEKNLGAGFYYFTSMKDADQHLHTLFPYQENAYSHLDENTARAYVMFEANTLELSKHAIDNPPKLINEHVELTAAAKKPNSLGNMVISGSVTPINDDFFNDNVAEVDVLNLNTTPQCDEELIRQNKELKEKLLKSNERVKTLTKSIEDQWKLISHLESENIAAKMQVHELKKNFTINL
ncbi:proteasome-activating nucleotidase [Acrasis kona]|uniref:Proteasome-activating nucleotidase n=1 Tax=Acrasis kona TaxID=1008807 RepID=A0AAW2ZHA2_9EUKA